MLFTHPHTQPVVRDTLAPTPVFWAHSTRHGTSTVRAHCRPRSLSARTPRAATLILLTPKEFANTDIECRAQMTLPFHVAAPERLPTGF